MFALFKENVRVTDWVDDPDVFDKTHPRNRHPELRLVECHHRRWVPVFKSITLIAAQLYNPDADVLTASSLTKQCATCGYRPPERKGL